MNAEMNKKKHLAKSKGPDEIVFMPFEEAEMVELIGWVEKDNKANVENAFGQMAYRKQDNAYTLNQGYFETLRESRRGANCLMVALRTPYRMLLHIGFLQLVSVVRNSHMGKDQALQDCSIERMYIAKAYRHKDYEYRVFNKVVEYAMTSLRADRCLLWVAKNNFLFLSYLRTLGLKLIKIDTADPRLDARYCFVVAQSPRADALQSRLLQEYHIDITPLARTNIQPTPLLASASLGSGTNPQAAVPDYTEFKHKLLEINKVHQSSPGHRKSVAHYSPILHVSQKVALSSGKPVGSSELNYSPIKLHSSRFASPQAPLLKGRLENDNSATSARSPVLVESKPRQKAHGIRSEIRHRGSLVPEERLPPFGYEHFSPQHKYSHELGHEASFEPPRATPLFPRIERKKFG